MTTKQMRVSKLKQVAQAHPDADGALTCTSLPMLTLHSCQQMHSLP